MCTVDEFTYEQIAKFMGVHRRPVDGFREGFLEKFGIKSKTGLVLFALTFAVNFLARWITSRGERRMAR